MSELNKLFDDPIEIYINKLCNYITDFILDNKLPITPNMISIARILLSFLLLFFTKNYKVIAVIYLICRIFDNWDGILARKGNMQSKLGDKLDHYGDFLETFILIILLLINSKNKNIYYFVIPIILNLYNGINIGCQQIYLNKNAKNNNDKKDLIDFGKHSCPKCLYNNKWIFKIIGYGVTITLITLFLLNIPKFNKN